MQLYKYLIFSVSLLFLSHNFTSCKVQEIPVNGINIIMSKTSCRGACPVYTLRIYDTGKMYLTAEKNIYGKVGVYKSRLSHKDTKKLINCFYDIDFPSMNEHYTSILKDLPTTTLTFNNKGIKRTIVNYDNAPAELDSLEEKIHQLVKNSNWKMISPKVPNEPIEE